MINDDDNIPWHNKRWGPTCEAGFYGDSRLVQQVLGIVGLRDKMVGKLGIEILLGEEGQDKVESSPVRGSRCWTRGCQAIPGLSRLWGKYEHQTRTRTSLDKIKLKLHNDWSRRPHCMLLDS